jgi:hypothetical protein
MVAIVLRIETLVAMCYVSQGHFFESGELSSIPRPLGLVCLISCSSRSCCIALYFYLHDKRHK